MLLTHDDVEVKEGMILYNFAGFYFPVTAISGGRVISDVPNCGQFNIDPACYWANDPTESWIKEKV